MTQSRDSGKEALRQIIEGLEGVTPGPWHVKKYAHRPSGETSDLRMIWDDGRKNLCIECVPSRVADHVARCHPDAMRAIAAYAEALTAQTEWLKARLAWLQLPPNKQDHDTREKWLIACGMPALEGDA